MIIGTAGHIDHGKTALIKALTGIDTDRLKEEKERGISIDLGFAYLDGEGGERSGVVDVPGHERFVRNMLAGVHGVDLVLLVVAADDGVMPQTEEHVDILHLLGVRHCIVALTKIDLVKPARRTAVREEIEILLDGTTLEGSPIFEVSPATGEGIELLREAIRSRVKQGHSAEPAGYFRLPIDRAFAMRGHGLVVTGTAIGGSVDIDSAVRILPIGTEARVRSIQIHGEPALRACAGQRVALNLAGLGPAEVTRGNVVCAPQLDRATSCFDAFVELRPAARRPVKTHAAVRVHLGTAETLAKIVWLDGREALAPKERSFAQIILRQPLLALGGDRFILRDQTARVTIGGGRILDPFAIRSKKRPDTRLSALQILHHCTNPGERLVALLSLQSAFAVAPEQIAAAANMRADAVQSLLAQQSDVLPIPDAKLPEVYTTAEKWKEFRAAATAQLASFHGSAPSQPGMEMESLRSQLAPELPAKVYRLVIAQLEREGMIRRDKSVVSLPSHRAGLGDREQRLGNEILELLTKGGFTPPDVTQIGQRLGVEVRLLNDLLAQLEREHRVARVTPDLCYAANVVERGRELIRKHIENRGEISAADLRDLIGASRKFSIALLSYFDRTGFTVRVGDVRKLRRS